MADTEPLAGEYRLVDDAIGRHVHDTWWHQHDGGSSPHDVHLPGTDGARAPRFIIDHTTGHGSLDDRINHVLECHDIAADGRENLVRDLVSVAREWARIGGPPPTA